MISALFRLTFGKKHACYFFFVFRKHRITLRKAQAALGVGVLWSKYSNLWSNALNVSLEMRPDVLNRSVGTQQHVYVVHFFSHTIHHAEMIVNTKVTLNHQSVVTSLVCGHLLWSSFLLLWQIMQKNKKQNNNNRKTNKHYTSISCAFSWTPIL